MIFELETAIKNKLSTITRFSAVYDFFTLETTGYPYVSFELSDFDGAFLDTCSNTRDFSFNIIVIQEMNKNLTRNQAKNIIYKCLEDIITKFDGDQDLGEGAIVKGKVSSGQVGTILEKEGSVLALSVKLDLQIITTAG